MKSSYVKILQLATQILKLEKNIKFYKKHKMMISKLFYNNTYGLTHNASETSNNTSKNNVLNAVKCIKRYHLSLWELRILSKNPLAYDLSL